ncbi:biopolymer transporter ExbD [Helicobacter saguini]|uniref:Biopolymer transporter ExbD n=1 Tax=Helicobacter saguini TaxID=1548018 RepID=A0A347VSM0_9HELI|nr:biopolymer transporter ExbD [Helicobacter saguini]MWV62445.1 biopolymer transporter ExbD [Helicobacter saguini]MWV66882.1 biopolymer transporter ExbD [Helicobacter saguini]MWV69231.1 biopolymer transporter ExbD [Helicobacter saguini]MWV71214.1 biopolymer transporter ExbD [Helicobacter saguini]TLD93311.1 biopolymer transporter ExbD [Helicobacter saguini]
MVKVENESEFSDINVTPFIDIMLVLLIIFMVVTPLMTSSVKIELPKTSDKAKDNDKKPIIIYITESEIKINDKDVNGDLVPLLDTLTDNNKDEVMYLYIDKAVQYEKIMDTLNTLKDGGYNKIALSAQKAKG